MKDQGPTAAVEWRHIECIGDNKGEVRAVRIENRNKNEKWAWGTTLVINVMRRILGCYIALIEELDSNRCGYPAEDDFAAPCAYTIVDGQS